MYGFGRHDLNRNNIINKTPGHGCCAAGVLLFLESNRLRVSRLHRVITRPCSAGRLSSLLLPCSNHCALSPISLDPSLQLSFVFLEISHLRVILHHHLHPCPCLCPPTASVIFVSASCLPLVCSLSSSDQSHLQF